MTGHAEIVHAGVILAFEVTRQNRSASDKLVDIQQQVRARYETAVCYVVMHHPTKMISQITVHATAKNRQGVAYKLSKVAAEANEMRVLRPNI